MENEEWRPVVGYEGLYEVSNLGRVRSLDRYSPSSYGSTSLRRGRMRKQVLNHQNGYYMLVLCGADGSKKTICTHRLVAMAFCENQDNLPMVNHKNEVKTDNRAENLEWCTKAYNNTYNGKVHRCEKKIAQMDFQGNTLKIWSSARAVDAELGIQYKNISAVCRGKRKSAGGYKWRFAECQR